VKILIWIYLRVATGPKYVIAYVLIEEQKQTHRDAARENRGIFNPFKELTHENDH
jgi:hypothetical protein